MKTSRDLLGTKLKEEVGEITSNGIALGNHCVWQGDMTFLGEMMVLGVMACRQGVQG